MIHSNRKSSRAFWINALAFFLFASALLAADTPSWRAGTGRQKITPDTPLWMTGYGFRDHPAEGTAQDLWTKALAVSDPAGNRGVLLTADLCMISRQSTERVAQALER